MKFPWEIQLPAIVDDVLPPAIQPPDDLVNALRDDMRFAFTYTAVLVHSNRLPLQMLVNTARGQIIPHGECKFNDGSTLEFQDIGMPQPGAELLSVKELVARVWAIVVELGLEIAP